MRPRSPAYIRPHTCTNGFLIFRPYSGIQDSGILPLLLLLLALAVAYYAMVRSCDFCLVAWMGYVFLLAYSVTILLCVLVFVP